MNTVQFSPDNITCEEGEYATADYLHLLKPIDLIIPADVARRASSDPVMVAIWLNGRISSEAMAGRKSLHIPAYLGLPRVIDALKELGYSVRQERAEGPWRISWEKGA